MLDGLPSSSENCPCVDECQQYAMERMGHSTNNMLKRVYQHTFKDEQESVTRRLDDYFDNI